MPPDKGEEKGRLSDLPFLFALYCPLLFTGSTAAGFTVLAQLHRQTGTFSVCTTFKW